VNLSIAGPNDPLLAALLEQGVKRGVIFVGALAGPDAGFPTSSAGVIAAGGTEHTLPVGVLGAPSEHVLTLRPLGQYDFESGTSVATAELTGVIALLMSASHARLSSGALTAYLRPVDAGAAPAVDVNAALSRLDAGRHPESVAARAAP
jgi:subtilisin family serine protease